MSRESLRLTVEQVMSDPVERERFRALDTVLARIQARRDARLKREAGEKRAEADADAEPMEKPNVREA